MKVGSIVEYVGSGVLKYYVNGTPTPGTPLKHNQPYTVRDLFEAEGNIALRLEEVRCPRHPILGTELVYRASDFRELLPPMEIQEALDSCEPVLIGK